MYNALNEDHQSEQAQSERDHLQLNSTPKGKKRNKHDKERDKIGQIAIAEESKGAHHLDDSISTEMIELIENIDM